MYALIDCNNFFVSCERVFNPKLHNRPVIVMSSNDGCAVSRSNEAKKLGVAMGEPLFKIKDLVRKHNIATLSSNFALYGELSSRVMSIIRHYMPDVSVYSIDEAFVDLTSIQDSYDVYNLCLALGYKIEQYTGIPVSIGIANTKTLAKIANNVAKKQNIPGRVCYLDSDDKTATILAGCNVRDVWGVGRKLEKKLHAMGVATAAQLINLPPATMQTAFNIGLQRTILELQGVSCIELLDTNKNKKQIMVSRSFGQRETELAVLQEALVTYTSTACENLRKQKSTTGGFWVFLHTGLYGAAETVYRNSLYVKLPSYTCDTRTIIEYAKNGLQTLFRAGFRYQKVGIILCDLSDADTLQIDLFAHNDLEHGDELMQVLDQINGKLGRATVQFAAAGLNKTWKNQCRQHSGRFTSSWDELPVVKL